jgi:hypothetical protein
VERGRHSVASDIAYKEQEAQLVWDAVRELVYLDSDRVAKRQVLRRIRERVERNPERTNSVTRRCGQDADHELKANRRPNA